VVAQLLPEELNSCWYQVAPAAGHATPFELAALMNHLVLFQQGSAAYVQFSLLVAETFQT
jgi:hypothetical protein